MKFMKFVFSSATLLGACYSAHAQFSVSIKSQTQYGTVDCNKPIPVRGTYSSPHQKVAITVNDIAATRPTSTSFAVNISQLYGKRTLTAKLFDASVSPRVEKASHTVVIACPGDPERAPFSVTIDSPADKALLDCAKPIRVTGKFTSPTRYYRVNINGEQVTPATDGTYTYDYANLGTKRTLLAEIIDARNGLVRDSKQITIACARDVPFSLDVSAPAKDAQVDCDGPIPVQGSFTAPHSNFDLVINNQLATKSSTGLTTGTFRLGLTPSQPAGSMNLSAKIVDTSVSPSVVRAQSSIPVNCKVKDAIVWDRPNRRTWILPAGALPSGKSLYTAIDEVVSELRARANPSQNPWTVYFGPGQLVITKTLSFNNLNNVNLLSDPSQPFVFQKATSGTTSEYLAACVYCQNVKIDGFTFRGSSPTFDPKNVRWTDQGLFMASTRDCKVSRNKFYDIGNAAVRVVTYYDDPVKGINSFNNTVEDNYFENIIQTSTTADGTLKHGGSHNYVFQRNTFKNLRMSVKFATRVDNTKYLKPGVPGLIIRDNVVLNSDDLGFEVAGYSGVQITGNKVSNAKWGFAFSTNIRALKDTEWEWGNDITFANNIVENTVHGLRFYNQPYVSYGYYGSDGSLKFADYPADQQRQFVAHRFSMDNNTFRGLSGVLLRLLHIEFKSLTNNKIENYRGSDLTSFDSYVRFDTGTVSGNTIDGSSSYKGTSVNTAITTP